MRATSEATYLIALVAASAVTAGSRLLGEHEVLDEFRVVTKAPLVVPPD